MNSSDVKLGLYQYLLSWAIFVLYAALWVGVAFGKLTLDATKEVSQLVMLVAFFWFQRQRTPTANDQQPGTTTTTTTTGPKIPPTPTPASPPVTEQSK